MSASSHPQSRKQGAFVADAAFILLTLAFFAVLALIAKGVEKL